MNENTPTPAETGANTPTPEDNRAFSQEDVNRIVGERLAKEKAKTEVALADREQELSRRELMITAREKLTAAGLPVELTDAINAKDAETLQRSIDLISKVISEKLKQTPPLELVGVVPANAPRQGGNSLSSGIRSAMGLK